ncbi:helix-turn-helix domain-containing protein [Propionispira raffinosivorans]|uniref:helix-turn-helix domain-containing protein n=1 Tax=Propionispira raffinosivorans TaxID=86959 RepID=UPI00036EDF92|nr:helix-turn-helix transcriptional regulator [Propionispira raffinosivorans]
MSLGAKLAFLREQKTLTQKEMAALIKISRSRLSLYEINQREPDLATLKQLADFFNVTLDYLAEHQSKPISQNIETESVIHLDKLFDKPYILWHGIPLNSEDKAKMKATLNVVFWDEKQKDDQKNPQ